MSKQEFMTLLTLQSAEGRQNECLHLLKDAFDDQSMLTMELFHSEADPEILLAIQKWSSFGVYQEYMDKIEEHELFINSNKLIDFIQVTTWKPIA